MYQSPFQANLDMAKKYNELVVAYIHPPSFSLPASPFLLPSFPFLLPLLILNWYGLSVKVGLWKKTYTYTPAGVIVNLVLASHESL